MPVLSLIHSEHNSLECVSLANSLRQHSTFLLLKPFQCGSYEPFFADFGPLSLGALYSFTQDLNRKLAVSRCHCCDPFLCWTLTSTP